MRSRLERLVSVGAAARGSFHQRDHRHGRQYTPRLWSVFISVPVALAAASAAAWLIYHGISGSSLVRGATAIDVTKTVLTVMAAIGAVLAGVYAYRKQRLEEGASHRADADQFTSRYNSAADQLGSTQPAIRLAGAYALARLADDWKEQRQVCVDVLCAYLRMPQPDPDTGESQVHQTIARVIVAHLQADARVSWSSLNFDFAGAIFKDSVSFAGATFSGESTSFAGATFSGELTRFDEATFSSRSTNFTGATFSGELTNFDWARFSGESTTFTAATFFGKVTSFYGATFFAETTHLDGVKFSADSTNFAASAFSGEGTYFTGAMFPGESTYFVDAKFSAGMTHFAAATFSGKLTCFYSAIFSGKSTNLDGATFSGESTEFTGATFSGESTYFTGVSFSGESTSFVRATFSGALTSFAETAFSGLATRFDEATFGEGSSVRTDDIRLINGASVTRDGQDFRGWPPLKVSPTAVGT